jgi:hypothetical protein
MMMMMMMIMIMMMNVLTVLNFITAHIIAKYRHIMTNNNDNSNHEFSVCS